MNILFVNSSMKLGGAEGVSVTLIKGWVKAGHRVRIVTLGKAEKQAYRLPEDVQIRSLGQGASIWSTFKKLLRLREQIKDFKADYVISFQYKVNVLTLLAAIVLPIPIIVAEHNNPANESVTPLWKNLRAIFYKRAHRVIALTQRGLNYFPEEIRQRGCVIENPLAEEFMQEVQKPKSQRPMKRVIAMGKLSRQKGFDLLLRAFAKSIDRKPDWRLVIFGEGSEGPQLERLISELKLQDKVELKGVTSSPREELLNSDLFVLSSRWEGFPCVLAEAMACQLPVIAFDCPTGPAELVEHGRNGLLVRNGNVSALAQAMSSLMGDEDKRRALSLAAVSVRERLTPKKILQRWDEQVFQEVICQKFHFYWSGQDFGLVNKLAITSLLRNHGMAKIVVHYEEEPKGNTFWDELKELEQVELKALSFAELLHEAGYAKEDFCSFFAKAKVNHRSDLLRYLLLYVYGGVYLDFDTLLLRSLRPLLHKRFFVAFQYYSRGQNYLNGAVLGAVAREEKLKLLIEEILSLSKEKEQYSWGLFGPTLLTKHFLPKALTKRLCYFGLAALERFGLANSVLAELLVNHISSSVSHAIYPRSYFYSITCFSNEWQELFTDGEFDSSAFLVHLWGKQSQELTGKLTVEEIKSIDSKYNKAARMYL